MLTNRTNPILSATTNRLNLGLGLRSIAPVAKVNMLRTSIHRRSMVTHLHQKAQRLGVGPVPSRDYAESIRSKRPDDRMIDRWLFATGGRRFGPVALNELPEPDSPPVGIAAGAEPRAFASANANCWPVTVEGPVVSGKPVLLTPVRRRPEAYSQVAEEHRQQARVGS